MSYGYSIKLVRANELADGYSLGVRLGKMCIKHDIPVSKVANDLGVSRQTVYNWFCGGSSPQGECIKLIRDYIDQLPD